jgi:nitroreductase
MSSLLRLLVPLALFQGADALALNGLAARRSVVKYDASRSVADDTVTRALTAATMAPNHFLSEPWRFYACGAETKAKLCVSGRGIDCRYILFASPPAAHPPPHRFSLLLCAGPQ